MVLRMGKLIVIALIIKMCFAIEQPITDSILRGMLGVLNTSFTDKKKIRKYCNTLKN